MQQLFPDLPDAVLRSQGSVRDKESYPGSRAALSRALLSTAFVFLNVGHSGPTGAQFITLGPADANKTNSTQTN